MGGQVEEEEAEEEEGREGDGRCGGDGDGPAALGVGKEWGRNWRSHWRSGGATIMPLLCAVRRNEGRT